MIKPKRDPKVKYLKPIIKDKVIHLRLPTFIYETLDEISKENQCTKSEVVRALVLEKFLSVNRINYERMNNTK